VANLSRNVVVRSSGTNTSANTAYLRNLVTNTTSFNANYGEFAYLGANASGEYGITFDGSGVLGSISSCTVRNGFIGVLLNATSGGALTSNNIFASVSSGLDLFSSVTNLLVVSNNIYGSTSDNIDVNGSYNFFQANNIYGSTIGNDGINLSGAPGYNTFVSNNLYSNGRFGLYMPGSNNLVVSNRIYSNSRGIGIGTCCAAANGNTLISNYIYSNGYYGLAVAGGSSGNLWVGGGIGYSSAAVAASNTTAEINLDNATTNNLVVKNALINPTLGIGFSGFTSTGAYLVNYSTNPGMMQIYGDYAVSGSTFTLDYTPPALLLHRNGPGGNDRR